MEGKTEIRAVPLSVCLSGFGRHFRTANGNMYSASKDDFQLSRSTERIQDFISHDWQTSRLDKVLSLLVAFNFRAVFIATTFVSGLAGVARVYGLLINHWTSIFLGYATFVLTLCFWQQIRGLFGKSRLVFLDCLCIPQHDEALKRQGILGLAAFLQSSERLTILWSQHWISRLWCVFELAAFLRAEQGVRKPVHLVPVKTAKVVVLQCLCWMLLSVSYELIKEVTQADVHTSVESDEDATLVLLQLALLLIIFTGIVLFILPAMIYIGLGITHEISELNAQLARFRVQDVQCFCCSINHRHPSTQATVPCDRELVHRMLRQWFSSSTTNSYLDTFNGVFQEELSSRLNHLVGDINNILPVGWVLNAAFACNMPWLTDFIPWWVNSELTGSAWWLWFLRGVMLWTHNTLVLTAMMRICVYLWVLFAAGRAHKSRLVVTLVQVPLMLVIAIILWLPFRILYVMTDEGSLLVAVPYALLLALNVVLFRGSRSPGPVEREADVLNTDDEAVLGPVAERELSPTSSRASEKEWHVCVTRSNGSGEMVTERF
ncbi:unnamed protein product [Effrenium voratum]|nr:unnamed protein product [Effrenium voratum]